MLETLLEMPPEALAAARGLDDLLVMVRDLHRSGHLAELAGYIAGKGRTGEHSGQLTPRSSLRSEIPLSPKPAAE